MATQFAKLREFPSAVLDRIQLAAAPSGPRLGKCTLNFESDNLPLMPRRIWTSGPSVGARARWMTSLLLAMVHGYHVPPLMDGWLTYDDCDALEVGFRAHCCSTAFANDAACELLLFWDGEKQLHVEWDDPEQMTIIQFNPRAWLEEWLRNILMWESRFQWRPSAASSAVAASSGLLGGDRWTVVRAARMRALREDAAAHAHGQLSAYLRTDDQERARAWSDLHDAIRLGGVGPGRSAGMH